MGVFRLMWRDADRLPYLCTLKEEAKKYDLDIVLGRSPDQRYAELAVSGDAEILAENYWNLQFFRAKGEPLVCVGCAVTNINEQVLAGPGINSLADLKGKRLAYRDQRPTNLIDPLWAAANNIGAELVAADEKEVGRWGSWKMVTMGKADAAITTKLFSDPGVAAGLHTIPLGEFGFLGGVVFTTSIAVTQQRKAETEAFVKACFDAAQTFKHDKAKSMKIIKETDEKLMTFDVEGDKHMERLYDILSEEIAEQPVPTAQAISNFHRMTFPHYEELKGYNPLTMWDTSFALKEIEARRKK